MLVQTCSKILALNSLTSNNPWILDAKHKMAFCHNRSQCQQLKGTSCNVSFFRTCKRTNRCLPSPQWMAQNFWSTGGRVIQNVAHSGATFTLLSTALYSLFPPGQLPKACLIEGMLCHHRQSLLLVSLQDWDKSPYFFSLLLTDINSLFILPEFESDFDSCNYLRYREL